VPPAAPRAFSRRLARSDENVGPLAVLSLGRWPLHVGRAPRPPRARDDRMRWVPASCTAVIKTSHI